MREPISLPPPPGYLSWLDYAIDCMDTRSLEHCELLIDDPAQRNWPEGTTRDQMVQAARDELVGLRLASYLYPITSDAEYNAALRKAEEFFDLPIEPDPNSPEGKEFASLIRRIEAYEAANYLADSSKLMLNLTEIRSLSRFADEHQPCDPSEKYPTRFEITSRPTGIGSSLAVTCLVCKRHTSFSDVGSW